MDLLFEGLMAFVALVVVLRRAWQGKAGASFFVAGLGAVIALGAWIRNDPIADVFMGIGIAVLSGTIGLIAHKAPKADGVVPESKH